MFKYKVVYDKKIVREMVFKVLRFTREKEGRPILAAILTIASILYILAICYYGFFVSPESFAHLELIDYLLVLNFLILSVHGLVSSWTKRLRILRKSGVQPDEVLDRTIDQDFVSLDESYYFMDDVICAEAYAHKKFIDLYMKFPSNQKSGENAYICARLMPQNLICGDPHALPLFLKRRLGERIRVFMKT